MRRITSAIITTILVLGFAAPAAWPAAAGDDVAAISQLLMAAFDKPAAPLVVAPVVVAGDHAIADWSQGAGGGRALLRRAAGSDWRLVLCAGEGIRTADALRKSGVPAADADTLASRLDEAEASVPRERRTLFGTFEGVVMMQGSATNR